MTTLIDSTDPIEIPKLPSGSVKNFIPYLTKNPNTPLEKLIEPFKTFERELRKVYAQQPKHSFVQDGTVNLIPIFNGHEKEITVRARSLATETDEEKSKYIMPLNEEERKANGAPAIVSSLKDFQQNFNIFSESSLSEIDWKNVVVAGSACTTSLLPVPDKWAESKRKLREYYHQHLAPASDVDIFLYGLDEEQALQKIKQIERSIKDSILSEVTTIRTKNAITIVSQHPIRHVQIVLRLYSSISEILTGFDVDCSCAAYDGNQVYAAPRALAAFMTQCNTIDLSRRSPSYENRLSKYSHRGFEVHWPLLDRSRVDPTIFERSFGRTEGLARLLILEKLPKNQDRETYSDQRRVERGRPPINRGYRNQYGMSGNIKDAEEDEVAEWVDQEEVASYHTMTVPYGPHYNAAKINRLLYAKDLLLNAEWNVQKNRDVYIHRHPCFFGTAEEVLEDCCGYCPIPQTDEEIKIAEEESKTMVSGPLKFIVSNPGAQMIGSFNPITDSEWTSMSYVGDTARLCQAIVDKDLEHVEDWCSQEGVDVNRRDYTGRTPLHLAVSVSSVEVVKCLVDHGARLIARLVDGRTALHIASARGDVEMIKILMNRSLANEEEESEKEDLRRAQRKTERAASGESDEKKELPIEDSIDVDDEKEDNDSPEASDISMNSEEGSDSMTMGSFVKIDNDEIKAQEDAVLGDSSEDPDVYEIDVIAWDFGLSALHYAIIHGYQDVIDLLVSEYGADVLLPVKLVEPGTSNPRGAIMSILLTLALPTEKAEVIARQLLALGATSGQGDQNSISVFHHVVGQNNRGIVDVLLENDRPMVMSVLNNIGSNGTGYQAAIDSPLSSAINKGFVDMASKLLELGATTAFNYDAWVRLYISKNEWAKNQDAKAIRERYEDSINQPIILAAGKGLAKTVEQLLDHNADPNTLEKTAYNVMRNPSNASYYVAQSLFDVVQQKLTSLRGYKEADAPSEPETLEEESFYTCSYEHGTYEYFTALKDFQRQKERNQRQWENYNKNLQEKPENGMELKKEAISKLIKEFEHTEKTLIEAGAKSFTELHPGIPKHEAQNQYRSTWVQPPVPPYENNITFRTADLNNNTRLGYIEMFEAAWKNDLEKIKSLTLAQWETKETGLQAPLKISVADQNGFTVFSIAVLRGHYDLAKKIVEICAAQYHKDDGLNSRKRWTLKTNSNDGYDDEDSDYDSDNQHVHDHLPIFAELVSEEFTIDNLGEVATLVKSDILPATMVNTACLPYRILGTENSELANQSCNLLKYAVQNDDMKIFKFITQIGAEQQALLAVDDDDQRCFSIEAGIFQEALLWGRTTMLAEMVKASGVGIPLNDLIKKSGIELKTKPKFYQGLSVGGKKRADWAQAPGETTHVAEDTTPPLLQSARFGNIDSVEWFMGAAPMRRYLEFAEANKNDKRIKTLQSGKGFEKTINSWLNAQSEIVLHCAILSRHEEKDSKKYLELLKYIVSVAPESVNRKSAEGWSPLQVAVFAQENDAVPYLISIGADQRSRDKMGRNMVHSMVASKSGSARTKHEDVARLIQHFDKQAVKEMLVERCSVHPGALTPLGLWMFFNPVSGRCRDPSVLEVLAEFSDGEDLDMINGEGDLPLHVAVRQNLSLIISYMLKLKPSLLYRENATGRTPLEMARDSFTTSQVNEPLSVANPNYWQGYNPGREDHQSIVNKPASDFVEKDLLEESAKITWEVCNEMDQKMSEAEKKRRLVSLFEANEVAKRLAARGSSRRGGYVINGGLVDGDVKTDIVSQWLW